jgi:pSer/pThr/pTyr-binding forkhead associated (FHA) protein
MAGEQLRVIEGTDQGRLLRVDSDLLLGRAASEDDGRLGGDPKISRRHARLSRGADGRLAVEDLGSANGTFVNDEQIRAARVLEPGDVVRVGRTVLEVTPAAAEVAAPAQPTQADEAPAPVKPPGRAEPAAPPEPTPELVITAGEGLGRRLAVGGDELLIGRAVGGVGGLSDDLELSRRHARVARDPAGRVTIEDLGSANGTFVNGERVRGRRVLAIGDSVRVGSTTLELSGPVGAVADAPPPPVRAPPSAPRPPEPPRAPARAAPGPPPPQPVPPGDHGELPAGAVFAGCRVEEVIGRGDMGVVYRAEELALQRPVALKVIVREYSSDERFRERFRRESRIAAAIDHPNIIPVFDAGEEAGVLYIMMRLVRGTDLRALIDAGRLEPLRAGRIVRQVGAALDAAHARGMIHRDVKPSNVLLARRDHAYLSDFGLAKPAESLDALTRQGTVVARAEYVAPEQILNHRVDARADVYALGCVLFEALTGEPPFARWTGGPAMLAHVDAPPPSPLDLRPDLPPAFDEVVRRAMAKDPDDRYPSAGDLGQAALVAAGGLRRADRWSVVATGEAAPLGGGGEPAPAAGGAPGQSAREPATDGERGSDTARWAIAIAGLLVVLIGMIAALNGIASL